MYFQYVETLADCLKTVFGDMTGLSVDRVKVDHGELDAGRLPVAQVIEYQGREHSVKGHFILGFAKPEMALEVAAALAQEMGLPKPEKMDSVAIDLLAEFMNTVVGRTISAWDRMGMPVSFGAPSPLQRAAIHTAQGFDTETYAIKLEMAHSQLVFHVNFSQEALSTAPTGPKILVVEDSSTLRMFLDKTLSNLGYQVFQAEDGRKAIELHREVQPQVCLMDLVMPHLGGLDAMIAIREEAPEAKFIVLTSSDRRDEVVTAKTLGVSAYLIKPVDKDRLLATVAETVKE